MDQVKLQHQIKENSSELTDLLQSLNNWEQDIKQRDAKLRAKKSCDTQLTVDGENVAESGAKLHRNATSDEGFRVIRDLQQANSLKEKGNSYFKKGEYKEAIVAYGKAIEIDKNNPVFYANRAMAYLKTNQFSEAESDCTMSISLDPTYVKAYQRRASARTGLNCFAEAAEDWKTVLKLEPHNKTAEKELKALQAKSSPSGASQPKREYLEVGCSDEGVCLLDPVLHPTESKGKGKQSIIQELPAPKQKVSQSKVTPKPAVVNETNSSHFVTADASVETFTGSEGDHSVPELPPIPHTSVQFYQDWKTLKGHDTLLFEYFQQIPPSTYVSLFGDFLESGAFVEILRILELFFIPNQSPISPCLNSFIQVKRFTTIVMFLDSVDKERLKRLFVHIEATENVPQEELNALKSKYQVK